MLPSLNWLWPWSRTPESASQSLSDIQSTPHIQPKEQLQPPTPTDHHAAIPSLETTTRTPPPGHLPNNLKLLFGGLIFLPLSLMLTRRAVNKRFISTIPAYYTSSTHHRPRVSSAMDGLEAVNLATLNLGAVTMLVSGGVAWKLGVNSVEDLRGVVRRFTRVRVEDEDGIEGGGEGDGKGKPRSDEEIESELQEWVAGVLAKQFQEKTKKEVERRRRERGEEES